MKLEITNVKDAIELMQLCGYPVKEVRWVTWGGGAIQDFDDDEELIEFAEAMRKRIDQQITGITDMEPLNWAKGSLCRQRCGLCTAWIERLSKCRHSIRHPVFYNTPTFGCVEFDDTCEDIRGQETGP